MKKLSLVLASLAVALTSYSQLLLEPFSYPDGPLVGASGSPWTTSSGTAGQQNVISGQLFLNDDETEDTFASLSAAVTSGLLTATFDLRISAGDLPSSSAGNYFTHFVANSGTQIGRVFTLTNPGGPSGSFRLGVSTTQSTASAILLAGLSAETTYSIALTYDFSLDQARLTVAGFGTVAASDTADVPTINRYGFRQDGATGDMLVDNLSVVPEPSTYAMIGLGVALLVGIQRSRRKSN